MSNIDHQNIYTKTFLHIALFVIFFICTIPHVFADSLHYENPTVTKTIAAYGLPENLSDISHEKLIVLKNELESALQSLKLNQKSLATIEQELLNTLIAYDDIRLQVSEIITKLVNEYDVTGDYKKKLLGYCDTFNNKIKQARNTVQTLDEYKAYSTHFAVAYVSLVYTFKQDPTFYKHYTSDINDPESTIGKYQKELATSYKKVEQANKNYEAIIIAQELEKSLVKVKNEIKQRKTKLLVINLSKQ